MANSIIRLPAVKIRVGLSRSAIYLAVSRKEFPQPVQLGARAVGWLKTEIEEWILERVNPSVEIRHHRGGLFVFHSRTQPALPAHRHRLRTHTLARASLP